MSEGKVDNVAPVAWLILSKDGRIRACLATEPDADHRLCAEYDGDTIIPLIRQDQYVALAAERDALVERVAAMEARANVHEAEAEKYLEYVEDGKRYRAIFAANHLTGSLGIHYGDSIVIIDGAWCDKKDVDADFDSKTDCQQP